MAVTAHQVAAYRVHFYGHSDVADDPKRRAEIFLISTEASDLGPLVGRLMFYAPEDMLALQDHMDDAGRVHSHLSITELISVLDVLRNEKPITVYWDDQCKLVWLGTAQEPVGEGEFHH